MAARKSTTDATDTQATDHAPEIAPKAKPVKRTPKAVTDLPTASAAFKRAKRTADAADRHLAKAQADAAAAHDLLRTAAQELDAYLDDVRQAVASELPTEPPADPEGDPFLESDRDV